MLAFSAPVDFAADVVSDFDSFFETRWYPPDYRHMLPYDMTEWVCNPKASFVIDDTLLERFPNLKILATPSTGTNHIDLDACKRRGVKVLSLLDDRAGLESISASAEFTFKLLLDAMRIPPAHELRGKTVGLVGFGRIGRWVSYWADAFEAQSFYYDPHQPQADEWTMELAHMFAVCDAVIICCALTDETRGMITKELLLSMKQGAALINTARGEVIDEVGLYAALAERPDLRFVTDVVHGEVEGRGAQSTKVLEELGALVTPHIAGETFESRTKAARIILTLLQKELNHVSRLQNDSQGLAHFA